MSEWYEGPSWQVAETEVHRWGVVDYQDAVAVARSRGVSPVYVLACVDFFKDHRKQLRPSDLRKRLVNAATFHDPDDPTTWGGHYANSKKTAV